MKRPRRYGRWTKAKAKRLRVLARAHLRYMESLGALPPPGVTFIVYGQRIWVNKQGLLRTLERECRERWAARA